MALIPLLGSDFFITTVMIPFLVFALAAIGLNLLTGYAGQLSLGTGGFMGVGAYACYKLATLFPGANILALMLASGLFSAALGVLFGLPSLRIKGFYLVVATLAAQFFLEWCFNRVGWLYNYNASGAIEVPTRTALASSSPARTRRRSRAISRCSPSWRCWPGSPRISSVAGSAGPG